VITRANSEDISCFKQEMTTAFRMSDLGLLWYYLGIEVKQSAGGIMLSQGAYSLKILEKAGMARCNSCQPPMEHRLKLSKNSSEPLVDATKYHSLVGSLRYLVNTRPDLADTCQALWIRRVLGEIEGTEPVVPGLMVDNRSVVALIKNLVLSSQSKHIEAKYHVVRKSAEQGKIEVKEVRTGNQALRQVKF
jgi:hypothetical protein